MVIIQFKRGLIMKGEVSRVSVPVFHFLAALTKKNNFKLSFFISYIFLIVPVCKLFWTLCAFLFSFLKDIYNSSLAPPPSIQIHVRPSGNSVHITQSASKIISIILPLPTFFRCCCWYCPKKKVIIYYFLLLPLCRHVVIADTHFQE